MNKISDKNKRTVVKIFINIAACASLLSQPAGAAPASKKKSTSSTPAAAPAKAEAAAPASAPVAAAAPAAAAPAAQDSSAAITASILAGQKQDREDSRRDREQSACKQATDKIDEATRKIAEACRKAGMSGSSSCVSKSRRCAQESGEESFDTLGAFATVLGVPAGNISGLSDSCPQMAGRNYFSDKDKIQKEIKDTEKELAELNDDKAKLQDEYNKEMQKIQETLTKSQEDYKKRELEIDQKERERIADFNNSQNQAKEELRKRGSEIIKLRGALIQSQRDKALKLIAMTEASGKRACMKAVNEAKKSYESVSSIASANHIAQAKQKKAELINIYNDCMSAFDQQRVALNESKRQEQEELNKQINDTQSSMDEIQNSLNLAANQLEEMKQATSKEKNDALQSVIDLGTRSQQQMQAAYTKLQENLKTLAAKSQSLQAALNRANQSLMTLGSAPKSKSSEYTPGEASSEIEAQINVIERAQRGVPESCRKDIAEAVKEAKKSYGTK